MGDAKYKAFISYSHKDRKWASWLHKRLEGYSLPAQAVGQDTKFGPVPKNLKPIFRDREELAAADNLGDKIESALKASENLIIICSPNAEASHWVNQEILYFKRNNRGAKIFSVIVDGEPFADDKPGMVECLPEGLRFEIGKTGDLTERPAEPLAADLRPQGDGKRLGTLKLISGMVGLGLDDLVQRDLARARKRVTAITATALATVLAMSTLTWFAMDARQEAEKRRADAEGLIEFMLTDLRDKLEPVGRLDALDGVASKVNEYYTAQDISKLSCLENGRRNRSLHLAAEIAVTNGNTEEFARISNLAFKLTKTNLQRCSESPDSIFDHAQSAFWSGYSAYFNNDFETTKDQFERYHNLTSQLVRLVPNNELYQKELAESHINIGSFMFINGNYKDSILEFKKSNPIFEEILVKNPTNIEVGRNLAESYGWIAKSHDMLNQYTQSKNWRSREIKQAQMVISIQQEKDWQTLFILGSSLRSMARIEYNSKNYKSAISSSLESVEIFESLVIHDRENSEWVMGAARAQGVLYASHLAIGQSIESENVIRKVDRFLSRLPIDRRMNREELVQSLQLKNMH